MRIGIVTDERIRLSEGQVVSRTPLTGAFQEILSDEKRDISFLCRKWIGSGGAQAKPGARVRVTHLPDWHMLTVAFVVFKVLRQSWSWARDQDLIIIVLPTFAGLIVGLLTISRNWGRGTHEGIQTVTVNRSYSDDSILLKLGRAKRVAALPALRLGASGYQQINRVATPALFVSSALASSYGYANSGIAPELDWEALARVTVPETKANRLLFVGRLEVEKNPMLALQAFEIAKPTGFQLAFVGGGSLEAMLRRYRDEREIPNVQFLGVMAHAEVLDLMAESRVVLIPSLSEAFGLVAFEALALDAAVIHSGAGGLPEAVGGDDNSTLVPTGSPSDWASAISDALNRRRLRVPGRGEASTIRAQRGWTTLKQCVEAIEKLSASCSQPEPIVARDDGPLNVKDSA